MRVIKFRGKHNGKWVYGDLFHSRIAYELWINTHMALVGKNEFIQPTPVDPDTVGQFTGLCDKNGKEIYEGDIVRLECQQATCFDFENTPPTFVNTFMTLKVTFENGAFYVSNPRTVAVIDEGYARWMEVIGNVWDTPELLKEEVR